MTLPALTAAGVLALVATLAPAQSTYQLDSQKGWTQSAQPDSDPDRAAMTHARQFLAEGKFKAARDLLDTWIDDHENLDSPCFAEAYYLRGNAKLGLDREFYALFDYEKVATKYPESAVFSPALEREFDVAVLYLNGLLKPSLGFRVDSGVPIAEEIILRINERLPRSRLAEKAVITLADYYYNDRDLKMAATAYDCFLQLFPRSEWREHAMQRRVFATIAQFKGPKYDASGLIEAKYQIQEYQQQFPIQAQRAGIGDALTARLDESAAAQSLSVANWYLRHGDPPSARLTLERLIRKNPSTASAHQAYAILEKNGWLKEDKTPPPSPGPEQPAPPAPAADKSP